MRVFILTIGLLGACVDTHRPPSGTDGGPTGDCTAVEHDVSVRSSADVADLPKTGCWDLYGKLSVSGSDVTSLAMLGDIRSANDIEISNTNLTSFDTKSPVDVWYGEIAVTANPNLTDFKNLTIHDGHVASVKIDGNAKLTSFELSGLNKIDTDLVVTNNAALTAVALQGVTTIDGGVEVSNNALLKTIDLGTITTVNKFDIENDPVLTSIKGAPSVSVLGDFILRGDKALTTVTGMASLNRIRGTLTIDHNDALTSLAAIPNNQVTLEGALVITNNTNLADVGGISHFFYIYSINIANNSQLAYCAAHEVLQCVSNYGNWTVTNNKNTTTTCNYWCN